MAKRIQPYKKPGMSPYASRKNTYSPPARGKSAPISAYVNAPASDKSPAHTQTSNTIDGEPTCCAMVADFKKIPVPIIVPTTSETVSI